MRCPLLTAQAGYLRRQRFVVMLDDWPEHSLRPRGHHTLVLGPVHDLEAETQALLVETSLHGHTSPFSPAALAVLPRPPAPTLPAPTGAAGEEQAAVPAPADDGVAALWWNVPEEEIARRRDLREDRLVFSVDPPGCEVRKLLAVALPCQRVPIGCARETGY